jgi:site-specific DNA-methyltransferase (adenine-specific)/adenine-specific DNA-methyltransferase
MSTLTPLTDADRDELIRLIASGQPLPEGWRGRLFPDSPRAIEIGKEYQLMYEGKARREEVLAETPAAPWQLVRRFCADRPFEDGWRNLLVWGDNLLALRELLADQRGPDRYGTRGKIKLIYIDPPFATRQDFMKDKEKAYQDKVIGAKFIEFLRKRLILLRELLAEDGSIFVHLDWKKGHYIKAVLDEVFGEENFVTEVVWRRTTAHFTARRFAFVHDSIFQYCRSGVFVYRKPTSRHFSKYLASKYRYEDSDGQRYRLSDPSGPGQGEPRVFFGRVVPPPPGRHWPSQEYIDKHIDDYVLGEDGMPQKKSYLQGATIGSVWDDISPVNSQADERLGFPTQKPEELLERVIYSTSKPDDIVLDAFAGSGTTLVVAEKLGRRWIGMDCGKLAIYTTQKRLFTLTTTIGAAKTDARTEPERITDWADHLKAAPAMLLVTERARRSECDVTPALLVDLAALAVKHGLVKRDGALSLACPRAKLHIPEDQMADADPEAGPGEKQITVDGVTFRISFVEAKDKPEKEKPLPAHEFALYRAGLYDMAAIRELPWTEYRPFVLKLFGVREQPHQRYGLDLDGYLGVHSVLVWNYPEHPRLTLDHGYVDDLHRTVRGQPGERFYVIAPVVAMAFAEDEVVRGGVTYVFLKVPLSVLLRLLERRPPGQRKTPTLPQPVKAEDVNEVINAVGFDFISQPVVQINAVKSAQPGQLFPEYVLELTKFRSQTLATEPEDYANFETFSMAMVDLDYGAADPADAAAVFRLGRVFWADDLLREAGGLEGAHSLALRIPEQDFTGEQLMVILCDRYGN